MTDSADGVVVSDASESVPHGPPNCDKCGKPTEFLIAIQRLGSTPGYRIFRCDACNVLQWIAEQT
jgi:hypothetical protein